ncbi:MAG: hypothetical protein KAS23_07735, partial [Anaerohalosphaera sp.]|nr:hypothetical protein [Anaerohalosphaera sp.]
MSKRHFIKSVESVLWLVVFWVMISGCAVSMAAQSGDNDLGLHSDGGPWRFYPCAKNDSKL